MVIGAMALAFVAGNCTPDLASSAHAAESQWFDVGTVNGVNVQGIRHGITTCYVTVPQGGIDCVR